MSDDNVWKAAAESTIYQVTEYRQVLMDLISRSNEITLDLSAINEVDVSFLQLLIAVHIAADGDSIKVNIQGAGDIVTELAESAGCQAALNGISADGSEADVA